MVPPPDYAEVVARASGDSSHRQHYGLSLIDGEHPMDTEKRIREVSDAR